MKKIAHYTRLDYNAPDVRLDYDAPDNLRIDAPDIEAIDRPGIMKAWTQFMKEMGCTGA